MFSKIDPPEVILYYLDDLRKEGVDISDFNTSQLPDEPPNFMKRPRGPSEKAKQAKKARLGESSGSRPPAPLLGPSETPPSTTRTSHQPSQKFNLATTTLPISDAKMLNETTSPSSSSSPESPLTTTFPQIQNTLTLPLQPWPSSKLVLWPHNNSDTHPPNTSAEPQTPTLNLNPPTSPPPPSEPENTLPTLEEAIMLFVEALVDKGLFEQVRNDFIRDAELRLQERLAREAEERARKEAEEKARQEEIQRIKEVEAKALAEAAVAAAKAEAKVVAEVEARLAEESANRHL
ncbi:eukaryotic translation initiation factor 4 gamma-like [Lathyrus oleraceus]|uniref:eukaryotic translation initiation factor 4 gamma-like n=1 Tax=Pisum sativum TaxID=3888 RepID=UPI0021CF7AA5|nr:eukaryotic translation initiation factor 4 gamma-like [Pisum sativum]